MYFLAGTNRSLNSILVGFASYL